MKNKVLTSKNEKAMTVREVAQIIGVSIDLVQKRVNELFPNLMAKGKTTLLDERQVTAIKLRIEENSSLATSDDRRKLAEMPKTDLEKELIIQQALFFQQEKIQVLQKQVLEMKPKVEFFDAVTGSADTIDMKEAAKILNIPGIGRNNLFEILRNKGILDRHNQPYQTFVDRGYFRVIESSYSLPTGETKISLKTVVFQKGLNFIRQAVSACA